MNLTASLTPPLPAAAPAPAAPPAADAVTVIDPDLRPRWIDLGELWHYRELLFFLTWRDIKVRYKQTALGVLWAFVQPVAAVLVFALFLGRIGGAAEQIPHYGLFVLAGMLTWTFFSNAITAAGNSVIANERLVTKVYFPRLMVPLSGAAACAFDFAISCSLLLVMMPIYGVAPTWQMSWLVPVVALLLVGALGVGTLLSALIVVQRDFRYVLNFGVQLWMFATPSIYLAADAFGETAQWLLPLNPVYGLVLNFRQAVLGGPPDYYALGVSGAVCLLAFAIGTYYFRRTERTFADII